MSDPRSTGSAGGALAGAIGSVVLLSISVPAVIAFAGLLESAPFFGESPTAEQTARSHSMLWISMGVSAFSFLVIVGLGIACRGRRYSSGVVVVAVIAALVMAFWLLVATAALGGTSRTAGAPVSSPSPDPTVTDGRFVPDASGTAAAEKLIARLDAVTFPADADPAEVRELVVGAGGVDPELRGASGDVEVGVSVGDRACVLGQVRAGLATWSVTGLSDDGGCLGPVHA